MNSSISSSVDDINAHVNDMIIREVKRLVEPYEDIIACMLEKLGGEYTIDFDTLRGVEDKTFTIEVFDETVKIYFNQKKEME